MEQDSLSDSESDQEDESISDNTETIPFEPLLSDQFESIDPLTYTYPQARIDLQKELLDGYTHPKTPASAWRNTHTLTLSES